MNFKTLSAIGAAATVAGMLAAPQAEAAFGTAWIWDGSGSSAGPAGTYSHVSPGDSPGATGWKDVIGYPQFDTSAIKVVWSGNNVTFTTYTNYVWNGFQGKVPLADWFFDLDKDGTFDFAFAPHTNGTLGDLQTPGAIVKSVAAMTSLGLNNFTFAHSTAICDGSDGDCQGAGPREPEVDANGTAVTGYTNITINDGGAGQLGPNVFGPGKYLHSYSFTLAGINSSGDWNEFRAFWGTGWCGNDTIEGNAVVPIPAAAWLFGSAILGLGAVGWKRRSSAA